MAELHLNTVRAELEAVLRPVIPGTWRTVNYLTDAVPLTVPALYLQFTGVDNNDRGLRLPPGHIFCNFDVIVVIPSTTEKTGEDDVDNAALQLVKVLDKADGVAWDSAKKERLEGGQWGWRFDTSVIATTN